MKKENIYHDIVKSTSIYGFSQAINALLGIVRSKITALLLGTVGVGIMGLFQSIIDLARSVTGWGLDVSSIREIATNSHGSKKVSATLYVVQFFYFITAFLGASFCVIFAKLLSNWAFETDSYATHIQILAIAVVLVTLTACITSVLQGLRLVTYMAFASTLGSLLSFIALIPAYYFWGVDGIVPMFLGTNFIIFLVAYFFYRKVPIKPIKLSLKEVWINGQLMIRLGTYLVIAGFCFSGSLFFVKSFLSREISVETAGLFQAVWATTSLFWSMVLRTVNADFFPKLSATKEAREAEELINSQTQFIILLILPVIVGLFIFSDEILYLLYSKDFVLASSTFRYFLLGTFLKIAITPMATLLLARNKGAVHLVCEILFWIIYLASFLLLYPSFKLEATGISYLIAYALYIPIILLPIIKMDKISWVKGSIKYLVQGSILFVILLLITLYIENYQWIGFLVVMLLSLFFSFFGMKSILGNGFIGEFLRKFKKK